MSKLDCARVASNIKIIEKLLKYVRFTFSVQYSKGHIYRPLGLNQKGYENCLYMCPIQNEIDVSFHYILKTESLQPDTL